MNVFLHFRAFFEFFRHLAIERCKSAHDALCLSVFLAECFFLNALGAFQKLLLSCRKSIAFTFTFKLKFTSANAFAENWFRKTSNFHVDKKEATPRKTRLQVEGDVPANGNTTFSQTRASSLTKRWNEAGHGMLGTSRPHSNGHREYAGMSTQWM